MNLSPQNGPADSVFRTPPPEKTAAENLDGRLVIRRGPLHAPKPEVASRRGTLYALNPRGRTQCAHTCARDFSPEPRVGAAFLPPMRDQNVAPPEYHHGVTVIVTGSLSFTSATGPRRPSRTPALSRSPPPGLMKRGGQSLACIRFPAVVS